VAEKEDNVKGMTMQAYELTDVLQQRAGSGQLWLEFLRKSSLSVGVYVLAAGSDDPQQPHSEDEVYYVLSGRGVIRVGEEDRPLQRGSLVFVGAHLPHHFHNIDEELSLLVFFAPAEGSLAA
jgi:mannose-6-phosphate isomerase-like protein (cupin superfamily)